MKSPEGCWRTTKTTRTPSNPNHRPSSEGLHPVTLEDVTMRWVIDDGGRAAAGFSGSAGDCVVRAIAIAAEIPYRQVYDDLHELARSIKGRSRAAMASRAKPTPRTGVFRKVYHDYLLDLGFVWDARMEIGSGCTTHMRADELPEVGRIICRLSRHLVAVVDGVIHDTSDPSRGGSRCVYGIYERPPHMT